MAGAGTGSVPPENAVVVAVRAEREISKTALAWALTHLVRPGDFVTLLAVICNHDKGHRRRFWSLPRFSSDSNNNRRGGSSEDRRKCEVSASCSQMALQFHGFQNQNEVNMRIKVVVSDEEASPGSKAGGAVVAESKRVGANWVVLDRQLKQEAKHCIQELPHCSVVLMKRSHAKVLRLNLGGAAPLQNVHPSVPTFTVAVPPPRVEQPAGERHRLPEEEKPRQQHRPKHSTPTSSSQEEEALASFLREERVSSSSSSTATGGSSSFFVCEQNPLYEGLRGAILRSKEEGATESFGSPVSNTNPWLEYCQTEDYRDSSPSVDLKRLHSPAQNSHPYWSSPASTQSGRHIYGTPTNQGFTSSARSHSFAEEPDLSFMTTRLVQEKFVEPDLHESVPAAWIIPQREVDVGGDRLYKSDVRDAVSLLGTSPSIPPPLCSICRHKAPVFGKPPRWFRYEELEEATGGFSEANFLAEGGFGWVHRGVLRDGQVVAVKRLKTSKGDDEFRAEVEVLSRAQHRNVVMLVGFCAEGTMRVLVYEYICNGSLANHLYGRSRPPLDWHARYRVAVGSARGLRYLHEDCRVGFIHRDVRPNNILLTHDFEPLVGDFGLARWQMEGKRSSDTRIIGTFGYLAPEYIESGVITEKADVYAFGVVLLELVTGRRAMDMGRPKGQQFLTEWARPVLSLASTDGDGSAAVSFHRLLDPRLDADQTRVFSHQLNAMARAASLCLRREPQSRPSMSKVLRLLEGETMVDPGFMAHSKDCRSARFGNLVVNRHGEIKGSLSQRISSEAVARALYEEMGRTQIC